MKDLSTKYMGIKLKNPIIAGASGLTANLDKIQEMEAAGVGAIVLKSLFEEQIQLQRYRDELEGEITSARSAEMIGPAIPDQDYSGPKEHLYWVKRAKEAVGVPVIGSLNAVDRETWLDYALKLADTGIDGLELNFYAVPKDFAKTGTSIEDEQIELLKEISSRINIPVAVKLSNLYTNPLQVVQRMSKTGIAGIVLFNRFFEPDIDVEKMENIFPLNLSKPQDHRHVLRYTGLLSQQIPTEICSSGGIFSAADVIKMILAGANAVQIVSALYEHGTKHIATILSGIEAWMSQKGYNSLADFQGSMNKLNSKDHWAYSRAQYVRILMESPEHLRRNKTDI
ncbi:MAG: dihydroorotate dehydrogenase-like protein [Candidatus Cloacimonetes bacterium]|nr:dihydroorotate dehydrogenase-like protein [Candidatus Cloacimonadota bacterium]MDD4277007.1 dihydroorotate dehydrogenase-like protein [Candidatus Cloacimonadota bacterium]MDY0326142.1 dihydroorotate dehydrogenase-like protein [Candidatus Cloacimonadaceae bacterium]